MVRALFRSLEEKLLWQDNKGHDSGLSDLHSWFTSDAENFMFSDFLLPRILDFLI